EAEKHEVAGNHVRFDAKSDLVLDEGWKESLSPLRQRARILAPFYRGRPCPKPAPCAERSAGGVSEKSARLLSQAPFTGLIAWWSSPAKDLRVPQSSPRLSTLAVGLVLAFAFGFVAQRLRLPPLIGYLLAG